MLPAEQTPAALAALPESVRLVIGRAVALHAEALHADAERGAPLMSRGWQTVWRMTNGGTVGRALAPNLHGGLLRRLLGCGLSRREADRLARDVVSPMAVAQWFDAAERFGVTKDIPTRQRDWFAAIDRWCEARNARNRVHPLA